MSTVLVVLAYLVWLACLYGAVEYCRQYSIRKRLAQSSPPPFDVAAARREAHAAGLPFPEADGSVSWPPAPRNVHDDMHARRLAAQPEVAAMERIEARLPEYVRKLREAGVDDQLIAAHLGWRIPIERGPDPSCRECDGAGVLTMGFARVANDGRIHRVVRPCHACRK